MSLYLFAEIGLGTSDFNAFKEAIEVANKNNCYIKFKHNGFDCIATPHGDAEKGVAHLNSIKRNGMKDSETAISR